MFWFETPPKVSKGAFNYVSRHWGNRVLYVINQDLPEYRKVTNWDDGDFGNAETVFLSECKDQEAKIREIFESHPNAIHVLSGFTNNIQRKIRPYILRKGVNLAVFSER